MSLRKSVRKNGGKYFKVPSAVLFFWCSLLIQKEAIVSPQQCDTDFCSDLRECVMQNVACSHRNHCVSIVQLN